MSRALILIALLSLLSVASCKKPPRPLAGHYHSTWGTVVIVGKEPDVAAVYPRGSMQCVVEEKLTLVCGWRSGESAGKARFERREDGTLVGTWGRGESESDGGAWAMSPDS